MIVDPARPSRELRQVDLSADLVVVGGGLAGVCASITAARQGIKVLLVQDRPVLGGNASSEVRLWVLGATSHMANNNRWSREGGVIDEILLENVYRNPEGNPHLFDALLLDLVAAEANVTLLLNTAVYEVEKSADDSIAAVVAFCSQNSTRYTLRAPLFCDASGDGIVGFLAGAAFRMGAERREEFGEGFAPLESYGELLGHSLYFYSKDSKRPVTFVPPKFALSDVPAAIPRYRLFNTKEDGCRLWWIEFGGRLDTVHDTETIKWELWKVVYGVWSFIKNSGKFPDAANLTLEWVGTIPGKRESRRFEGDYMLTQQDIVEQRRHLDDVSVGGWAIDLHPADGVYSEHHGCAQWHSKGVYAIPYRTMYSRDVSNLFLAGRIISASHVAFGSTRVMATCAHNAQAVGVAAALCVRDSLRPRDLIEAKRMRELQTALLRTGQFIPHIEHVDETDLTQAATITASSVFTLDELPPSGEFIPLERSRAMLVPLQPGKMPTVTLSARSIGGKHAKLVVQLRTSSREGSFTPDEILETHEFNVDAFRAVSVPYTSTIETKRYGFITLLANPEIEVALSDVRVTGVLSVSNKVNPSTGKPEAQTPPADIGIDVFEMWPPDRRPGGKNLAMKFDPPLGGFDAQNVTAEPRRSTISPNAWVAASDDASPTLELHWGRPQLIREIALSFDGDFDHALESVLLGHPERVMPFCVAVFTISDDAGEIAAVADNHQTRRVVRLDSPRTTRSLRLQFARRALPTAVFRVEVR